MPSVGDMNKLPDHLKSQNLTTVTNGNAIMKSGSPVEANILGEKVQNCKLDIWNLNKDTIMPSALCTKITQKHHLTQSLKNTGKNILVDANPFDSYWGVCHWKTIFWKKTCGKVEQTRNNINRVT